MMDRQGRLFVLELSHGQLFSVNPDGSDKRVLVDGARLPDGVAVDVEAGHVYWTNMGVPSLDDGSVERIDLDGRNRVTIVPPGGTHTPKQLHLDTVDRKLYWGDREGMRVMRCDLDGSHLETLVETGSSPEDQRDETRWCVGVAIDHVKGHAYWTQKGPDNGDLGMLLRAGLDLQAGETPGNRSDVEVLFKGLPEPIDLEIDATTRMLYWTDRGDPPRGNTVNRTSIDAAGGDREPEILTTHLMEGIGIALDPANNRMFVTDLTGSIYAADMDGSNKRLVAAIQGNLTGIAYAEVPVEGVAA